LIGLSLEKKREALGALDLSQAQIDFLWTSWAFCCGDAQLPPDPVVGRDWTTWLFMGGRGAGKTRAGAEWVRALVAQAQTPLRIALVAESYGEARMTMIEGVSGLMKIGPAEQRPAYFPSLRELRWRGGSVAQIFSSEDPQALRGPQFHYAWCDELAKWRHGEETWAMLQMGLRLGARPRQAVTTTPRPVRHLLDLLSDPSSVVTRATSYDNRANLAPAFFGHIVRRYEGTSLGRQELGGELIDEIEGTLFKRADIERARVRTTPAIDRLIVAVDPPVTAGDSADECGIVVAGCAGEQAYVLADRSAQGLSPMTWARRVVETARAFGADRVVVEVNQGGDLVATLLHQVDPMIAVRKVHATRGKFVRAEPVAALYEQGRVHHVGMLGALEDQMAHFTGGASARDDRLDALVWALTDLLLADEPAPRLRKL
jgi:phage terminase large subunit-like protein